MPDVDPRTARNDDVSVYDDLARKVYCILGMPIDAIKMSDVLQIIDAAATNGAPFVISTPNLNFLVNSRADPVFAESLLLSDLCPPDGMPVIWIARLLGIPIKRRVAGSDIFEALKAFPRTKGPLKIFLFGATERAARAACQKLNEEPVGLRCTGWICPGFGTFEELSRDHFIDQINSSNADFLAVALGARKGQLWLRRNHDRLEIPIRAHLGATINFQAGLLKRAPSLIRKLGLEWAWRIKEEPYLWKRYSHDAAVLVCILIGRVLPIAASSIWLRLRRAFIRNEFDVARVRSDQTVILQIFGYAIAEHVPRTVEFFRDAIMNAKRVVVDLAGTRVVDARFLGLLLMLKKQTMERGVALRFVGISSGLKKQFHLHGVENVLFCQ